MIIGIMFYIQYVVIFMIGICKIKKHNKIYYFIMIILDFPNEILSYIIENLNLKDRFNISLTCKKFNTIQKLTYIKTLTLSSQFNNNLFKLHPKIKLLKLERMTFSETYYNFKYIKKLELYCIYNLYKMNIKYILENCCNLEYLKLSDCYKIENNFLDPLKNLKKFTTLKIYSCIVKDLPDNLDNLKYLYLGNYFYKNLNSSIFEKIKNYKNIKSLEFLKVINISEKNILSLKEFKHLENIVIKNCIGFDSIKCFNDFKFLKTFSIINSNIVDKELNIILNSNIEKFDFSNSKSLKGNIKTKNTKCKEINFYNCLNLKKENLKTFQNIINLQILGLQMCKNLNNNFIDLKYNKNLKKLIVTSIDVSNYIELKNNLMKLKIICKK